MSVVSYSQRNGGHRKALCLGAHRMLHGIKEFDEDWFSSLMEFSSEAFWSWAFLGRFWEVLFTNSILP